MPDRLLIPCVPHWVHLINFGDANLGVQGGSKRAPDVVEVAEALGERVRVPAPIDGVACLIVHEMDLGHFRAPQGYVQRHAIEHSRR